MGAAAAQGAVEAPTTDASLRIAQSNLTAVVDAVPQSFSLVMWLRRTAAVEPPAQVLDMPGSFELLVDSSTQTIRSRLLDAEGDSIELALPLRDGDGMVPRDEWILIAVSWHSGLGRFAGWARADSAPRAGASMISPGFVAAAPQDGLRLGRPDQPGGVAQPGIYGLIVIRDHELEVTDVEDLWTQRDYFGPYRLINTDDGGRLTGAEGAVWMTHHAILTAPSPAVTGAASVALPGSEVELDNYCLFNAGHPNSSVITAGQVIDSSAGADAFIFRSPYDVPGEFFVRQVPAVAGLPDPPVVPGRAPKLRQIAFGAPRDLIRCVVSANSRAARLGDAGEQTWPENYAHGFIDARLGTVAGVVNRPAGPNHKLRWFGFDALDSPRQTGEVVLFHEPGPHRNFARLWSHSAYMSIGPGAGLWMAPDATFALKCRPEPGSLVTADAPLRLRAYVLRFPGAGAVSWRPVKAAAQDEIGTFGPVSTVDLAAATEYSYLLGPADAVEPAASRLVLDGDHTGHVNVGDAAYVSAGPGQRGFSIISEVLPDDQRTRITFEHWFVQSPGPGSSLVFGPWAVETLDYEWPALAETDPEVWRGLQLAAVGGPVVNFAWDAWRPDLAGIVFGLAGWGGNGYTTQINESFAAAIPAWMAALQPDVWIQAFAQQNSGASSMTDFRDVVRRALPQAEVAWLGDGEHYNATYALWHHYILDEAASAGAVAATLVTDPAIGTYLDQAVDGLRANGSHLSHRGNTRLAERWLQQLREAALPSPDLDGDGLVGVSDFLALLGSWGLCPPADLCPGDFDGDGEVGIADFDLLLGSWG